jgi:hypothetical protein
LPQNTHIIGKKKSLSLEIIYLGYLLHGAEMKESYKLFCVKKYYNNILTRPKKKKNLTE